MHRRRKIEGEMEADKDRTPHDERRKRARRVQREQDKSFRAKVRHTEVLQHQNLAIRKPDSDIKVSWDDFSQAVNAGEVLKSLREFVSSERVTHEVDGIVNGQDMWEDDEYVHDMDRPHDIPPRVASVPIRGRGTYLQKLYHMAENGFTPTGSAEGSNNRLWKDVMKAFRSLLTIRLLRRFVDQRNPELHEQPLPDGGNIRNEYLRNSWVLQRYWKRSLEYGRLSVSQGDAPSKNMDEVYDLVLAFNHLEVAKMNFEDEKLPPQWTFLKALYDEVWQYLVNIAGGILDEVRANPQSYSILQTQNYNTSFQRLETIIGRSWPGNIPQVSYAMLTDLLHESQDLECIMSGQHGAAYVDDVEIEKHTVYTYDEWKAHCHQSNKRKSRRSPVKGGHKSGQVTHKECIRKISQVNTKRRDHLLLRDWSKKRPWKQLYKIYNTATGELDSWRPFIHAFHEEIAQIQQNLEDVNLEDDYNPSLQDRIASTLIPIRPLTTYDNPGEPTFKPPHFHDGCSVCSKSFLDRPHTLLAQLHCSHLFHLTCIRGAWDATDVVRMMCPVCRSQNVEAWHRHDQTGTPPFETNDDYWSRRKEQTLAVESQKRSDFKSTRWENQFDADLVREYRRRDMS